ncbi:oxidoreductase [Photobacterium gaetbulicola]|uniref:Oxidoreductase n=1 Tax=Photobacterium gaetbulicola TaxID=1295392 RepID=A0A0B9H2D1_9GAMM|nr:FAD-binding oxidoreductase [Photobacterium gaetbulicola]KHT62987.1 oxidoreductase [Photobacterium gaetbulicola]
MLNLTPVPIKIVDCYDDGENTRHYQFAIQETEQHLSPWLKAESGQFFMLCLPGFGEAPFTFTTLPNAQGDFRALVRRMGSVTDALFQCGVGDIIGARGPYGRGWPMERLLNQRILIVGGGCGIAPLASVINQLIDSQQFIQLEVVYAARNQAALMLNPERARWQHLIPIFNVVEDMAGLSEGEFYPGTATGILPKVLHTFGEQPDTVLLAGPEAMQTAAAEYLVAYGIDPKSIFLSIERRMHCAVGLCGHCYLNEKYVCSHGPTFSWAELLQYDIAC